MLNCSTGAGEVGNNYKTTNGTKHVLAIVLCPDCEKKVKLISDINTDWYGNLKYYRCRNCKETFVSQNDGKLEIAAR
jgi:predicted SprT family Zn-dependent metalloprotease